MPEQRSGRDLREAYAAPNFCVLRRLFLRVLAFLTGTLVVRVVLGLPDGSVAVTVRLSRAQVAVGVPAVGREEVGVPAAVEEVRDDALRCMPGVDRLTGEGDRGRSGSGDEQRREQRKEGETNAAHGRRR